MASKKSYGRIPVFKNYIFPRNVYSFKGGLSCPKQFLAIESPLEMMKNVFYSTLKALFIFRIF